MRLDSIWGFCVLGANSEGPVGSPTAWKNKRPGPVAVLIPGYNICKICDDLFLDHMEQLISNNFFIRTKWSCPPQKNLSWLFPSQMMNSYVQECLMIQLDIFRQRMKHSTSNYCYFVQNNAARLKMHHDPSLFKQWTTEFEWQDNFTHRMSNFWHLTLNAEWRMANVLLTSRSHKGLRYRASY